MESFSSEDSGETEEETTRSSVEYEDDPTFYVNLSQTTATAGAGTGAGSGAVPAPVSSNYCLPDVAHFVIDQKVRTLSSGKFGIKDSHGKRVFKVRSKRSLLHTKRVLRSPSGETICLMRKKLMSAHDRWSVHRGDAESDSSVLFTVARSHLSELNPSFNVYLGHRRVRKADFTVKGDIFAHNYTFRYRIGNAPVAEVKKKSNLASLILDKDQYAVTVNPGVDYAFILTVVVIIDQTLRQESS